MDPAGDIERRARELGFEAVGFAPPDAVKQAGAAFLEFIELGRHGDMDWLAARAGQRRSPKDLWPEVKSVIALGMNYGPATDPMKNLSRKDSGNISVYARGRDYHDVFKKRLKKLGRWMAAEYGCELKVFVDTAPVLEKPLAAAAGIGWQGKHTNLVSREYGSWLFLGAIFTTLEIAASRPHEDHCGDCRACMDACPTAALTGAYRIDPRRCISYLTIESKGAIPPEFRKAIGNRIYGCDDCLAVCPWNKFAETASEAAFHAKEQLNAPELETLLELDDAAFRKMFAGSPVKRTGRDRFIRNVLIAAGNSGEARLCGKILPLLDDGSALVRAMAVWALSELGLELGDPDIWRREKARRSGLEDDPDVLAEWRGD